MSGREPVLAPHQALVEILHVDTVDSESLYTDCNDQEKVQCQKLFRQAFEEVCAAVEGEVRSWAGDGGHAFIPSQGKLGAAVEAATAFLENLSTLDAQTAQILDIKNFHRQVRIKAHRGEVVYGEDGGTDSGDVRVLDHFLKHEKVFAPKPNMLFITDELYRHLPARRKRDFQFYEEAVGGKLRTKLYRKIMKPVKKAKDILEDGDRVSSITRTEWSYLQQHILAHKINIAARNGITLGLIKILGKNNAAGKHAIQSGNLQRLTMQALYNYLRAAFRDHNFRVSLWTTTRREGGTFLELSPFRYPRRKRASARSVAVGDRRYMVARAFRSGIAVVTPSVPTAAREGKWHYFDEHQGSRDRDMASALQLPVYKRAGKKRITLGVLSLDSGTPDMFLNEEVELWREELIHYLVNLALAFELQRAGC